MFLRVRYWRLPKVKGTLYAGRQTRRVTLLGFWTGFRGGSHGMPQDTGIPRENPATSRGFPRGNPAASRGLPRYPKQDLAGCRLPRYFEQDLAGCLGMPWDSDAVGPHLGARWTPRCPIGIHAAITAGTLLPFPTHEIPWHVTRCPRGIPRDQGWGRGLR